MWMNGWGYRKFWISSTHNVTHWSFHSLVSLHSNTPTRHPSASGATWICFLAQSVFAATHAHTFHTRARTLFYSSNYTLLLRRKSILLQFVPHDNGHTRTHFHTAVFFSRKINNFRTHTNRVFRTKHTPTVPTYNMKQCTSTCYLLCGLGFVYCFWRNIKQEVIQIWRFPANGHNPHCTSKRHRRRGTESTHAACTTVSVKTP